MIKINSPFLMKYKKKLESRVSEPNALMAEVKKVTNKHNISYRVLLVGENSIIFLNKVSKKTQNAEEYIFIAKGESRVSNKFKELVPHNKEGIYNIKSIESSLNEMFSGKTYDLEIDERITEE